MNYSHRCPKGNRQMRQAASADVQAERASQAIATIAHRLCRLIWKIPHERVRYEQRGPAVSAAATKFRAR